MKKLIPLLLPLLFAACAPMPPKLPSDNQVAPAFRHPEAGALILMLPPETETEDMQAGVGILKEELHRQLSAAGYRVAILDQTSYDTIWAQEIAEVGGIYDGATGELRRPQFVQALGHLVQRVSSETKATLVMRPHLVLRTAELSGVSAVWDGQQRRSNVSGAGDSSFHHDGTTLGLSVGLRMFASSGEFVMSTHGGVSLPYKLNLHTNRNEVRTDLFKESREMADGVSLALSPLLQK
ncbi:hypothetical protein [Duganella caerulea]|uniref:hypothetical protein n=1 Tax=Duganella caerulea TaxID=2885762 RepID=UPI004037EDDC